MKYLTNRLGLVIIEEFIPTWDELAHIYVLKKVEKFKPLRPSKKSFNVLLRKRIKYYNSWANVDKIILRKARNTELVLFGAGEISQLIACYLPETFNYIKYIVVDNTKGVREFNKHIYKYSEVVTKENFFLIGSIGKNKKIIKTKLQENGISSKKIISLQIS